MADERERRVVFRLTCERCGATWHLRLRADRLDQFNATEPTVVCACGASVTAAPGEVSYVGHIPEPSAAATPHLRTETTGTWECGGCGQRWHSNLEGEVQDLYTAENSNPTSYICGCGSKLLLRQWNFHTAPLEFPEQHPRQGPTIAFTETERLVLEQVVDGKSNAEIARRLSLSEGTVRNVVSSLYRKLGVKTRLQAANAAIIAGFAQPQADVMREATTNAC
jgi:DNA-binding CsgD family transcriptional regulator